MPVPQTNAWRAVLLQARLFERLQCRYAVVRSRRWARAWQLGPGLEAQTRSGSRVRSVGLSLIWCAVVGLIISTRSMRRCWRVTHAPSSEKVAADELALAYILDSKPSPWLAIWQAKIRAVTALSRMLKLNPAGRHSAAPAEPALPVSYFDRMALEAQRNGDH
jgi:hypothetical protein